MQLLYPGRAERPVLALLLALLVLTPVLVTLRGQQVLWAGFLPVTLGAFGMIALGLYARNSRTAPRLGSAATGLGFFACFSSVAAIAIYALFPLQHALIDPQLVRLDARLGYHWPALIEAMAAQPILSRVLYWIYISALPQLVAVILVLAMLRRDGRMWQMLLAGSLSMLLTVAIWWTWPSLGPSVLFDIPAETLARTGLFTDPDYGIFLMDLAVRGPGLIRPEIINGVIALPSFHIVMALMVAVYSAGTPARIPALLLLLAMVPATLGHGGHHLVDLVAGTLVFGLCAQLAAWIIPERTISGSP